MRPARPDAVQFDRDGAPRPGPHQRARRAPRRGGGARQHRRPRWEDRDAHRRGTRRRGDDRRRGADRAPRPGGRALPRLPRLRVGDLSGGYPSRRQGRDHDGRRHAARQAADADGRGAAREAGRDPRRVPRRLRRVRRLSRERPGRDRRDGGRGRGRLQALHRRRRPAGHVPRRDRGPDAGRDAPDQGRGPHGCRPLRECADRRLRDRAPPCRGPERRGCLGRGPAVVQRTRGSATCLARRRGDRLPDRDRARDRPAVGRRRRRGTAPGRRRLGRDVPALPLPDARGDGRRRAPEVEPAQPRPRLSRLALAAAPRGPPSQHRLRPRAVAEGARRGHLVAVAGGRQRPRDDAVARRHRGSPQPRCLTSATHRSALDDTCATVRALPAQGYDPDRLRRRLRGRGDRRPPCPRRPGA